MSGLTATVITAVRNGERYLEETIESVRAQSLQDWEYIVVDDGSTDATAEVIERAMKTDSRIRAIIRSSPAGPYAAANRALAESRGRYIFRVDGDDLQPPERFAKQLEFLAQHPQYRASVTNWRSFRDPAEFGRVETLPPPGALKWYLLLRSASIHSSLCIERAALAELGGYRELPLSQDYRLWCDLTRRGWLGVQTEVLSFVRFHAAQSTNQRRELQQDLARDVLRDHWSALTGAGCSEEELETLWALGYSLPHDLAKGLRMLDRWNELWHKDALLSEAERAELARLSEYRRYKFVRANLRRKPVRTIVEAVRFGVSPMRSLL